MVHKSLPVARVFGFTAFAGFEGAASLSEETRNPRRSIPPALSIAIAGGIVFYVFCDRLWNGHPAQTTTGGLTRASIGALAERGIVGRAVLADLPRHEGVPHLEMHRRITVADVEAALAAQGTELRRGDILLLRTGIFRVFYEDGPEAFYADFDEPGLTYEPGLIDFVAEHDIAGLGSDTMCNEQAHNAELDADFPLHVLLQRNLGVSFPRGAVAGGLGRRLRAGPGVRRLLRGGAAAHRPWHWCPDEPDRDQVRLVT